ncbi:hypothetical protein [Elizabethkingia anophelis]|uniref:hypothetical protein n=1 Tax=Elizabethkingia anophelis TaxID=1117645 RepID=UPI0038916A82
MQKINYIVILLLIGFLSCKSLHTKGDVGVTSSTMFEKFDFELDKKNYEGFESVSDSYGFYKLKDGWTFLPRYGSVETSYEVIPPKPSYYHFGYFYYLPNGNKKEYGKFAGLSSRIKIGIWKYYDKEGKLIKEANEEDKFGLWNFNKVMELLDKDRMIDLKTGKNREDSKLEFNFDESKKEWKVIVFKKNISVIVEEYWEYLFDGNTGKYTRNWYERYNKNAEKDRELPPLKNSKANKKKQ